MIKPTTNIDIVSIPNNFCAVATTASLFGITPVILNPCSINCPKGSKLETIALAPIPNIIYPNIGPNVPTNTLCHFAFNDIKPMQDTIPSNNAGSFKTSLKKLNT